MYFLVFMFVERCDERGGCLLCTTINLACVHPLLSSWRWCRVSKFKQVTLGTSKICCSCTCSELIKKQCLTLFIAVNKGVLSCSIRLAMVQVAQIWCQGMLEVEWWCKGLLSAVTRWIKLYSISSVFNVLPLPALVENNQQFRYNDCKLADWLEVK